MDKVIKPSDLDEYKKWLEEHHEVKIDERLKNYYNSVGTKIRKDFEESPFWQAIIVDYADISLSYKMLFKDPLFTNVQQTPVLEIKSFESFLEKTFRKNIIDNHNWPEAPEKNGWMLPNNWYENINDVVRTYFTVKYLDGVEYLIEELERRANTISLVTNKDFEAKDAGYYAAHFYVNFPCEIPRQDWDTQKIIAKIELQITTQLQEIIRNLSHQHYAKRRVSQNNSEKKWQWNYKSDEFSVNYLGHILHYLEGMIMDIREKQKEGSI